MCKLHFLQFQETCHVSEITSDTVICHISDHFGFWTDPAWIIRTYALLSWPMVSYSQCFQRGMSSHQPLTSSVLRTGQLLLNCINTTAPGLCVSKKNIYIPSIFHHFQAQIIIPSLTFFAVLRETLLLIEKQSGAIGAHKPFSSAMRHNLQPAGARAWARRLKGLLDVNASLSSAWTMHLCFQRRNEQCFEMIWALKSWVFVWD